MDTAPYFRLYPDVAFVSGKKGGVLYFLARRETFRLSHRASTVLRVLETNASIQETARETGCNVSWIVEMLSTLQEHHAGCFFERPPFVEKIRQPDIVTPENLYRPPPHLHTLHVVPTSQCGQKCSFCKTGSVPQRLWPCRGCWRGSDSEPKTLSIDHIAKALEECSHMECQTLLVHAGDARPISGYLTDLFRIASKNGYRTTELITGAPLSDQLLGAMAAFNVSPTFQLYSSRATNHDSIAGVPRSFSLIAENMDELRQQSLPFNIIYINTEIDNDPEKVIRELYDFEPLVLHLDRLVTAEIPAGRFLYGEGSLVPVDVSRYIFWQSGNSCLTGRLALGSDGVYSPCPLLWDHKLGNVKSVSVQELFARESLAIYWNDSHSRDGTCMRCEYAMACAICKGGFAHLAEKKLSCGYNCKSGEWYGNM